MAYDQTNFRSNVNDFLNAHQAYVNNQYGQYMQEKEAYQQFQDMQARAQYESEAESQYQQQSSGATIGGDALSGAATGASAGALAGPWGAAIGGIVGGLGGLAYGLVNKDKAKNQYDAAINKAKTAPVGTFAGTNPNVNGVPGGGQLFSAANQLGRVAGQVGQGFQQQAGQQAGQQAPNGGQSMQTPDMGAPTGSMQGPGNATTDAFSGPTQSGQSIDTSPASFNGQAQLPGPQMSSGFKTNPASQMLWQKHGQVQSPGAGR